MITFFVKLSTVLKPYQKVTYLLAIIIIANVGYQFLFSATPAQPDNKAAMFSLLAIVWLALINLMLQVFTLMPEKAHGALSILARIKCRLHSMLYYVLSVVFIGLSIILIVLSFKMFRV
jgi:hypothetical protein